MNQFSLNENAAKARAPEAVETAQGQAGGKPAGRFAWPFTARHDSAPVDSAPAQPPGRAGRDGCNGFVT